jgi:hypothetical protein
MTDYREYVSLSATPLCFSCIYISVAKFFIIWGTAHMTDTRLWPCDDVGRFLELPDLLTLSSRPPKILYLSLGFKKISTVPARIAVEYTNTCTGTLKAF